MFKKIIPFMLIAFVTACAAEPQPAPVAEKAEQCKCVKNKDGSCRKCTKNGKKCQCPHAKKGDKAAKPSAKTEKPASTDGKTEAK